MQRYPFKVMPLPYHYDALEPYIDEETMRLHHDEHYQGYVNKLNEALENHPELHYLTLNDLLSNLSQVPTHIRSKVRNNGGGVLNHELYFTTLAQNTTPHGKLKEMIEKQFGSIDDFKKQMKKEALDRFGSGWAWLGNDNDGNLFIVTTPNQDTTLPMNINPIIPLDLWEHAYYLKYHNRRDEYIDNWFNVINWDQAEANYLNNIADKE